MGSQTNKSWNLQKRSSSSSFEAKFRQAKYVGTIVVGVGTIIAILGLVIVYVVVPAANLGKVKNHLNLNNSNSVGRKTFEFPRGKYFNRFYFFRLDHSCEIVNGEKPEVVQRGPYTFRAEKHRVHVQNDHDSDTLSYETVTSYKFDSNNSCEVCQSTDHMIFVNIPLVTLIHLGRTHHKFPARFLPELNKAILWNGSHPDSVVTFMKVDEFLFNGWNPPCLQWFREAFPHLEQYLPERFYPEGFALQKSSIVSDFYTIKGGQKNIEEMFHIEKWGPDPEDMSGDLTPVRWWTPNGGFEGSNACNWLIGTEGFQFAPLIKKGQPLWMFHREMCRSIELVPGEDQTIQDVPVIRYVISENSLLFNTKRNLGFCMEAESGTNWSACVKASPRSERLDVQECLLDPQYHGYCHQAVWDVTSCMDGIPLALSLPHFYQAPAGLRTSVKGLSSSYPPFHETQILVEPNTGMVVKYKKRLQFNLHLESDPAISQMLNIRKVLLPLFWYEESYDMDDMTLNLTKKDVLAPNQALQIVQWFVVAFGVVIIVLGIVYIWFHRVRNKL